MSITAADNYATQCSFADHKFTCAGCRVCRSLYSARVLMSPHCEHMSNAGGVRNLGDIGRHALRTRISRRRQHRVAIGRATEEEDSVSSGPREERGETREERGETREERRERRDERGERREERGATSDERQNRSQSTIESALAAAFVCRLSGLALAEPVLQLGLTYIKSSAWLSGARCSGASNVGTMQKHKIIPSQKDRPQQLSPMDRRIHAAFRLATLTAE